MKTLTLQLVTFTFVFLFTQQQSHTKYPHKIFIDLNRNDNLALSEISEDVKIVSLESAGFKIRHIFYTLLIGDTLFIVEGDASEMLSPRWMHMFSINGEYLGEFAKATLSGKYFSVQGYDKKKQQFFIDQMNGYRVFNKYGLLVDSKPGVRAREFHKGLIWRTKPNFPQRELSLVQYDLDGQNPHIRLSLKVEEQVKMMPTACISTIDDDIYVSYRIDRKIYKLVDKNFTPFLIYEFKNDTPTYNDLSFGSVVLNKSYIKIGYRYNLAYYDYFIFKNTEVTRNIKYRTNKQGKLLSGILDDVYNTGYLDMRYAYGEETFCLVRKPEDIKAAKIDEKHRVNPVILIIKLK